VWIRFVLVPGLTDDPENIAKVARLVGPMKNVEWVEVLPLHQMGAFKWQTLGLEYKLADTPTPTGDQVRTALEVFRGAGCRAR
jgi:pyruvate formate lyase activating enzyme